MNLHNEQLRIESQYYVDAQNQRQSEIDRAKSEGTLHSSLAFLTSPLVVECADVIRDQARRIESGENAGWEGMIIALPALQLMSAETMAAVTLQALYESSLKKKWKDLDTKGSIATNVGDRLFAQYNYEVLSSDPDKGQRILANMMKYKPAWVTQARAFGKLMKKANDLFDPQRPWSSDESATIGGTLVSLIMDRARLLVNESYVPVFTEKPEYNSENKQKNRIILSDQAQTLFTQAEASWVRNAQRYPIMVTPPTPMEGAGNDWSPYLTMSATMVKQSFLGAHGSDEEITLFDVSDTTRRSVDAQAQTRWRINSEVLTVARAYFDHAGTCTELSAAHAGLPINSAIEGRKNLSNRARWSTHQTIIETAEQYEKYDDIFFPCNIDFRSRVYPLPVALTPQGQDIAKGLLMFSEKKRFGMEGWLAFHIQVANQFGQDSGPLADRIKWVVDNHDKIMDCGMRPFDTDFWWTGDAEDTPWTALACAIEYAAAVNSGSPESFESCLPCQVDGKCSGVQHHAAATRCTESGPCVALTDNPDGLDIYEVNAEYLQSNCKLDMEEWARLEEAGDAWREEITDTGELILRPNQLRNRRPHANQAKWWDGKFSRKIAKLPTMTTPYGVTNFGLAEQTINKMLDLGYCEDDDREIGKRANYFVSLANDTLTDIMPGPCESMKFFKDLAGQLVKQDDAFKWTTPAGDKIKMSYPKSNTKRVNTMWGRIQIRTGIDDTTNLRADKQRNAASANWVHSRDAAHLHITVDTLKAAGIDSFSMIHDSFGTHACDMAAMNTTLRDIFVDMYSGNVFEEIQSQIEEYTTWPTSVSLPQLGELDVADVRDSELFFC